MTHDVALAAIDPRELRNAFGQFGTGVTVVTTRGADGTPHGATVNAFTAVSLDPPLAQVTLTRSSKAARYLEGSCFAINILSVGQMETALHFAGKPMNREPDWTLDGDVPVLIGNTATLECRPWNIYDGGDHIIVVGEVVALEVRQADPLIFFAGKFRHVGDHVDGMPWAKSGDGPDGGWFSGASSFKSFAPAPE
ncbi:flavin reductase family protein [Paeniglutamicibacter cryotolerans]|uniref:Flavin reductase (DIM6/NTAB) family NADH-FMN oxidoreductase RutF n=1 Tax=Paeniglutamicibacter cryotolerans TaxID=670079 RepID=A0A839QF56_9MICC|nr:flavin reductase family protein [Paeniglutamicibacter cryotolerans]MBB2994779.1 flavin reductase (DIM6/NTAB) family NADH-FMN oxidoreductase RutF [Paeniglutamicibacter cryotolerans]